MQSHAGGSVTNPDLIMVQHKYKHLAVNRPVDQSPNLSRQGMAGHRHLPPTLPPLGMVCVLKPFPTHLLLVMPNGNVKGRVAQG